MAKSSRSKWKKLHKRQRAKEVSATVQQRVSRLHAKLQLSANGGLSAVPMSDPETRFHFNRPDDTQTTDFHRPLRLQPPRSCLHSKRDPHAPHRMTREFEVLHADTKTAGHAPTHTHPTQTQPTSKEAEEMEEMAEEEEMARNATHQRESKPPRITSMTNPSKSGGKVVLVEGNKKTRRLANATSTRLVKSGGTAAKKKHSVRS